MSIPNIMGPATSENPKNFYLMNFEFPFHKEKKKKSNFTHLQKFPARCC